MPPLAGWAPAAPLGTLPGVGAETGGCTYASAAWARPLRSAHSSCAWALLRLPGPGGLALRRNVNDVPTKGSDYVEKADLTEGFLLFSAEEREVLLDALAAGQRDFVGALVLARRRTQQRRDSDTETDVERRLLVGARVSRKRAERFRKCAQEHGLSLYRFVCNALEHEYQRLTK